MEKFWEFFNNLGDAPTELAVFLLTLLGAVLISFRNRFIRWWRPSVFTNINRKTICQDNDFFVPSPITINNNKINGDTVDYVLKHILLNKDHGYEDKNIFALLAPTGVGKTVFLNQLFLRYERYSRRRTGPLLLYGTCADLGTNDDLKNEKPKKSIFATEIDNLFETRKTNAGFWNARNNSKYIPENSILLLDGFDEDVNVFGGNEKASERLRYIAELVQYFRKVILVSRIQFFDSANDQPDKIYKGIRFHRIYLEGFGSNDVWKYVKKRKDWAPRLKTIIRKFIENLPEEQHAVYTTPFILSQIESIIDKKDEYGQPLRYFYDIYDAIIESWEQRENKKFDGNSKAMAISELVAREMLALNQDYIEKKQLEKFEDIEILEEFGKSDRTLMRVIGDSFSFAHRSIFEFFVTEILINDSEKEAVFDYSRFELSARILFGKRWKDIIEANSDLHNQIITPELEDHNRQYTINKIIDFLYKISRNPSLHNTLQTDLQFALYQQIDVKKNWFDVTEGASVREDKIFLLGYFKNLKKLKIINEYSELNPENLAKLTNLESLWLQGFFLNDLTIIHIGQLQNLESLSLESFNITDKGLKHIRNLQNLKSLSLISANITDEGLSHIKYLNGLTHFSLIRTEITDAGLIHLNNLVNLESLELSYSKVTDIGLANLQTLTKLKDLYLNQTSINGVGFGKLSSLINLERLHLTKSKINDDGLFNISKFSNLIGLHASDTQITDKGLYHIRNLLNLKTLEIINTQVTDLGLYNLRNITDLCSLNLGGERITDSCFKYLMYLKNLEFIGFWDAQITDKGFSNIKDFTNLKSISLRNGHVTEEGLKYLKKLPRLKNINLMKGNWSTESPIVQELRAKGIWVL